MAGLAFHVERVEELDTAVPMETDEIFETVEIVETMKAEDVRPRLNDQFSMGLVAILLLNVLVWAARGTLFTQWEFVQLAIVFVVLGAFVARMSNLLSLMHLKELSMHYYSKNPHLEDASLRSLYSLENSARVDYFTQHTVLRSATKTAEGESIMRSGGYMLVAWVFVSLKVDFFDKSAWDLLQLALSLLLVTLIVLDITNLLMKKKLDRLFEKMFDTAVGRLKFCVDHAEPCVKAEQLREWVLAGSRNAGWEGDEEWVRWLWPIVFDRLLWHPQVEVWEPTLKVRHVWFMWRKEEAFGLVF